MVTNNYSNNKNHHDRHIYNWILLSADFRFTACATTAAAIQSDQWPRLHAEQLTPSEYDDQGRFLNSPQ